MRVVSVVSTKGGMGKTTVAANLGGLLVDAGLRVLLLDLDSQPTLSSYYALSHEAIAGAYECIALNLTDPARIISRTLIPGLDLIISNDNQGRLSTLLLHAPRRVITTAQPAGCLPPQLRPAFNRHPRRAQRTAGDGPTSLRSRSISHYAGNARRPQTAPRHLEAAQRTRAVPPPGHYTAPFATATETGECHPSGHTDDHPWPVRDLRWGNPHLGSRNHSSRPSGIPKCSLPRPTSPPNRDAPVT